MLHTNVSPFPNLKSLRINLRELGLQDAEAILVQRSHPEINKYIKRDPAKNIEDAIAFLVKIAIQEQNNKSITWAIHLKDNQSMIGQVCLWNIDHKQSTAELGYSLHPDYFRQGIMTEAVTLVLEYGLKQLSFKRIDAFTHKENLASLNLLSRMGFLRNLELEKNLKEKSELEFNQIFSIFK